MTHGAEERRDFGRRERGRRLVEQQHAGAAFEFAEQLDALLHADREVFHDGIRIDVQPVLPRQRAHVLARRRAIDAPAAARFAPEQDVLPYAQPVDELEVLMHQPDRRARLDGARVGHDRAERDRRQGRFAGTVFTNERVDFAGLQFEVDAVDRDDVAEAFADAPQGQRRLAHKVTRM